MMLTMGLIVLFSFAAVTAVALLAWQISDAAPKIAGLRAALADCPQTRELRFMVRETLVTPRHGQVVALPVKLKPVRLAPPLRAAA